MESDKNLKSNPPEDSKVEKEKKEEIPDNDKQNKGNIFNFKAMFSIFKLDKGVEVDENDENQLFLKNGVNLTKKDEEGRNIIHKYCLLQKKDILKGLLDKVSNAFVINEEDDYGNTPLLLACKNTYNNSSKTENSRYHE